MSPAELRADLSERLGERVIDLFTREGGEVSALCDLYQPSPAGFAGRLRLPDGRLLAGTSGWRMGSVGTFTPLP